METMVKNAVETVQALAATSSKNDKIAILREAADEGNDVLFKLFRMAYDSQITFGVKKVPESFTVGQPNPDWGLEKFKDIARKLETRELTGNDMHAALEEAATMIGSEAWNTLYRPCLMKDMRCGVTDTLVNNAVAKDWPDYAIPVWKVQLAVDAKKHPKKMVGKKLIDPKLDGARLTAVLDKERGTVKMFTRNGKENTNFDVVIDQLKAILLPKLNKSIVLDGEIVSDNFQNLMTQVNRKSEVDTSDAHYAVFDMLPLNEFNNGVSVDTQFMRDVYLDDLNNTFFYKMENVYAIPKKVVNLDTAEGVQEMQDFFDECIAAGYEGIMVKDPDAMYECKRARNWLKWKPVESADLIVTDVEEGTGKNKGKFGAFCLRGDVDGVLVEVKVGTGFSDEQRESFWNNRDETIGETVEIEYDAVTKSRDSDTYSLRFPRFKRFRSIGEGKF